MFDSMITREITIGVSSSELFFSLTMKINDFELTWGFSNDTNNSKKWFKSKVNIF